MKGFVERSRLFIAALSVAVFGIGIAAAQDDPVPPSVAVEVVGFEGLTVGEAASGTVTFTLSRGDLESVVFKRDADFAALVDVVGAEVVGDIGVEVDEDGLVAALAVTVTPTAGGEGAFTVSVGEGDAIGLVDDAGEEFEAAGIESIALAGATFTADVAEGGEGGDVDVTLAVDISGADLSVVESYAYTGLAIAAEVTVVFDDSVLVFGADYTLEFANNVNVGTATVTVVGKGGYKGTIEAAFEIVKKAPEASDFEFTIPSDHVYTGEALGIGEVTLKAPIEDANAVITVSYYAVSGEEGKTVEAGEEGDVAEAGEEGEEGEEVAAVEAVEPVEVGTYIVKVSISGGDNIEDAVVTLGEYVIYDSVGVSVAASNREVPVGGVTAAAAVAPVKQAAVTQFSVGPSPVAKSAGKVSFFWHGKPVSGGKLCVYDAAGNAVKAISVVGKGSKIGEWDLRGAKGALVANGTYLAKGVLAAKDGTKEKVSFVFVVR